MNLDNLVVNWEDWGDSHWVMGQQAMNSESQSFPVCSNPFDTTNWQHQWLYQCSSLVPDGVCVVGSCRQLLSAWIVPLDHGQRNGTGGCHRKEGGKGQVNRNLFRLKQAVHLGYLGPRFVRTAQCVLYVSWGLQGEFERLAGHLLDSICYTGRGTKASYCLFYFFL